MPQTSRGTTGAQYDNCVLPAAPAGLKVFAPSIRLGMLREAVEDFEYVQILKRAGRGAWALGQVRTVAPDWVRWNQDPQALEALRMRLGQEIDAIAANHTPDGGNLTRPAPPGAPRVTSSKSYRSVVQDAVVEGEDF